MSGSSDGRSISLSLCECIYNNNNVRTFLPQSSAVPAVLMKTVNSKLGIDPSVTPPLTPTYISPRLAPLPPSSNSKSFKASFHTVFRKPPPKPPSLQSAHSAPTSTSSTESSNAHPYSSSYMPPLPVVTNHSPVEDDDECPVCLEPLSFSFRLPGEKPHIVPECGHALHEVGPILL